MKITGLVIVILIIIVGGYFLLFNQADSPTVTPEEGTLSENPDTELGVPAPGFEDVEEMIVNDGSNTSGETSEESTGTFPVGSNQNDTPDTPITQTPPLESGAQTVIVDYNASGYTPKSITISKGDTVRFTNSINFPNWPASAFHPTHTVYPGSSISKCNSGEVIFDACRSHAQGESFEFTFDEVGTWNYHNHVSASRTGTIIVE